MRIRPAILGLALAAAVHLSATVVYVPGRLENGVYIRPHFMPAAEASSKPPALDALTRALAAGDALEKLPPQTFQPVEPRGRGGASH